MSRGEPIGDADRPLRVVELREEIEVLHEEIGRLPETYRIPVVLCDLNGQTHAEAARRLRCPVGTVSVRLRRARDLLRRRLTRRGLSVPAGVAIAAAGSDARAAVSPSLIERTVQNAMLNTGRAATASASVAELAREVLRAMFLDTLKRTTAAALALSLAAGLGLVALRTVFADPSEAPEGPQAQQARQTDPPPVEEPPATPTDLQGDPLPVGAVARLGTVRFRHKDEGVTRVAFSPDGTRLASAGGDRLVRIWDVKTGAQAASFSLVGVRALRYSPDGQTLAAASGPEPSNADAGTINGTIMLRETATGEPVWTIEDLPGGTWALAFSPDGKTLATGGAEGTIHLRDAANGAARGTIPNIPGGVRALAFSPDGTSLLSGDGDGKARLWDLATGKELRTWGADVDATAGNAILSVAFAADGQTVAVVSTWMIVIGKLDPDQDPVTINLIDRVRSGCFAADLTTDGTKIITQHYEFIIEWDTATGRELRRYDDWGMGGCLALTPDGTTAAVGSSSDAAVHLLNLNSGAVRPEKVHRAEVVQVAFAPDGKTLASAGLDKTVRVWDVATSEQRHVLRWPGQVTSRIAYAPDGQTLAVGGMLYGEDLRATIRLCDPQNGAERQRIDAGGAWLGARLRSRRPDAHHVHA